MNHENALTVSRLLAENVLKLEQFELRDIDKLTLIRGANNQGKTTVLRLLGLCVRGADDPAKVIHDGAKKATVEIGLTNGYQLARTFTPKGEYFKILDEQGHEVPSPQKFVNRWLGEYRDFNPLAWLSMPAKEQVRVLLQAIDVRLSPEEFQQATGHDAPFDIDFSQHGLLVLDALRSHYAEERKAENRLADQKKKAATDAMAALPQARPIISDERRRESEEALTAAQTARTSIEVRKAAASSHQAAVERVEAEKRREIITRQRLTDEIRDYQAQIEAIQQKMLRCEDLTRESYDRTEQLDCELSGLASSAPPTEEDFAAANELIRRANALTTSIAADEKILARFAAVERMEQEAADAAAQANITDSTIKILDTELRAALMAKAALPVDDLTIEDGRILVGGHELQYLAESQQIRIAIAIARALRPALRVIVLDGTESLDTATFQLFLDEIRGDGFRYFASEVDRDGGALEVITFGEDLAVRQQEVA